jgi:hypothetical protein
VSDESGGTFVAPESTYLAGVRGSGRYCDSKQLSLCQAEAGGPAYDLGALAAQYAPRLRFDQESGTGSECMDVTSGSTASGANVIQHGGNGGNNRKVCNQPRRR